MIITSEPKWSPNTDVIRRPVNAKQIAQRRESTWVIDFGIDMHNATASFYEMPYAVVEKQVAPARLAGKDKSQAKRWWLHARPSPKYRAALNVLPRVIATPCVSKHWLFVFLAPNELADHGLAIIARSDDTTFGILCFLGAKGPGGLCLLLEQTAQNMTKRAHGSRAAVYLG